MPVTKTAHDVSNDPFMPLGTNKRPVLAPFVETVNVTGTLVVEEVKATVVGLKLQVLCGGRYEQAVGESVPEPVKPFCAVKVKVVDPDCPGLAMLIDAGLAVIENVSPTSTRIVDDVDPEKFESPLY